MKSVRQFLTVALLMVTYLTPAMACMVSNVQMSAEERACCQAMQNRCEQTGMPASHGCCQKVLHSALDNALRTNAVTYHPVAITAIWLTAAELFHPTLAGTFHFAHVDYSPPQSPPGSVSILRI